MKINNAAEKNDPFYIWCARVFRCRTKGTQSALIPAVKLLNAPLKVINGELKTNPLCYEIGAQRDLIAS